MSPRRTLVKICGLCSPEDASAAVAAGADAVGVVLADGPRQLGVDGAAEVLRAVPPTVARVGVFVDPSPDEIAAAVDRLGLRAVQLHGSESPEFCAHVHTAVVKAFRVGDGFDPDAVRPYRDVIAAALLDALVEGRAGGTGITFDWRLARGVDAPAIVLAGGLRPDNVADAVRAVRPHWVDVSSGVESSVRHKDPRLMAGFVAAVRRADEETCR